MVYGLTSKASLYEAIDRLRLEPGALDMDLAALTFAVEELEGLREATAILDDLVGYVARIGRDVEHTKYCPFCRAYQGDGHLHEEHTVDCVVTRAEALRETLG